MRLPLNVQKFAEDKQDLFKAFADYVNHYRNQYQGASHLEYDKTISFDEKNETMHNAIMTEINKASGVQNTFGFAPEVWATNPMYRWTTFAVVTNLIDAIIPSTIVDSIGLYTDIRQGGYGDNFAFDIKPSDLFVVSKGSWGKRKAQVTKQFNGQVTITPEVRDLTVGVSLYRVLAGKENLAEFAMKAVRSIETQMTVDAYTAFAAAMTAQPTGTNGLKVSGYSQDELVRLCQTVTAFNGGAKAIIAGTQTALARVLPSNSNYRMDIASDFVKVGYVRNFAGFDVMALPQVANWGTLYDLVLDDAKLYVVSPSTDKILKMCIEGQTISINDDAFANANLTQTTTLKKAWGVAVCTSSKFATVELSS